MRLVKYVLILGLVAVTSFASAQSDTVHMNTNWDDTTYYPIKLYGFTAQRILEYNFGHNAAILLDYDFVLKACMADTAEEGYFGEKAKESLRVLDSLLAVYRDDTIVDNEYSSGIRHIMAKCINKGDVKVFDKGKQVYVDVITNRLERYGEMADRFYYLPGIKPFYSVDEYSGIIDNPTDTASVRRHKNHYKEYVKMGEKLKECGK